MTIFFLRYTVCKIHSSRCTAEKVSVMVQQVKALIIGHGDLVA